MYCGRFLQIKNKLFLNSSIVHYGSIEIKLSITIWIEVKFIVRKENFFYTIASWTLLSSNLAWLKKNYKLES